jgi:Predicted membrane protein
MVIIALYILSGVNFPVAVLPKSLQLISYSLPLTRGIQAAHLADDQFTFYRGIARQSDLCKPWLLCAHLVRKIKSGRWSDRNSVD